MIWSVLCGIRTTVVELYGLDYKMYDFLESIELFSGRFKFTEYLEKIKCEEIDFTREWLYLSGDKVFNSSVGNRYHELIFSEQ